MKIYAGAIVLERYSSDDFATTETILLLMITSVATSSDMAARLFSIHLTERYPKEKGYIAKISTIQELNVPLVDNLGGVAYSIEKDGDLFEKKEVIWKSI